VIHKFNSIYVNDNKEFGMVQTYTLKQGFLRYGKKGKDAAFDEMKQQHERGVFIPINVASLSDTEKDQAMESLIFLVGKSDKRIKARTCANGSVQRKSMNKDEASSPTVATKSIFLTSIIDTKEKRDVMTSDIPNAFVQTSAGLTKDGERIIMKIRGPLVDMLVDLDPNIYKEHVLVERGSRILYVHGLKAIYGMLQSALLFYKS
jgi:hypothetical protein